MHGRCRFRSGSVLLVLALALGAPAAAGDAPGFEAQLREHLQRLDRSLGELRLRLEGQPNAGRRDEAAALRRQLRALEAAVHRCDPEPAVLLAKVRALEPLAQRLERAAAGERMSPAAALRPPVPDIVAEAKDAANDDCADATPIGFGTFTGNTRVATADGQADCGSGGPPASPTSKCCCGSPTPNRAR